MLHANEPVSIPGKPAAPVAIHTRKADFIGLWSEKGVELHPLRHTYYGYAHLSFSLLTSINLSF